MFNIAQTLTLMTAAGLNQPVAINQPPVQQVKDRIYNISFQVLVSTRIYTGGNVGAYRSSFNLSDVEIKFPIIAKGAFSQTDLESLTAQLWLDADEDPNLLSRTRLEPGPLPQTHNAIILIPLVRSQDLRWQIKMTVKAWSCVIPDESALSKITWPQQWPSEVNPYLQPQLFIESDQALFTETIEKLSEGTLRQVPPFLAAKDLIRFAVKNVQLTGDGIRMEEHGAIRGFEVQGAVNAAQEGRGSPNDLLCVCIAMLRAAEIPARPVIGLTEDERGRNTLISWGEFYLPDAGWIPFDPHELRGNGLRDQSVYDRWPGLGAMKDLNRRIPITYHFTPPTSTPTIGWPAIWGWNVQPNQLPRCSQQIILSIVHQGQRSDQ